jgi:Zn-dependent protease with chaperone function/predicted small secreted protein
MRATRKALIIIVLFCVSALIAACGTAGANRDGDAGQIRARINAGADVNTRDPGSGRTLLHDAVSVQDPGLVESLAENGADVNAADGEGITPLILAARAGNRWIAYILLEKGADACASDSSGYRASDYARSSLYRVNKDSSPELYEQSAALLRELKELEIRQFAVTNPPYAMLLRVVQKVGDCLNPGTDYAVYISSKDQINAWMNITGSITFTQKALDAWDEDTLTLVAAHEIAHDKLGHVAKTMGVSYTTSTIMAIAGFIVPGLGYLDLIVNPAVTNNFSKLQEYDADRLAAESCNKCFGMTNERQLEILRSMKRQSKNDGGGFFSTHPAWNDRIENIRKQ